MSLTGIPWDQSGSLLSDVFEAARTDNVEQLRTALAQGESLDARDVDALNMTPIHIACIFSSNAFLQTAVDESSFDPWIRDANGRVAFDHAWAKNNRTAMRLLFPLMHPTAPPLTPA